MGVNTIHHFVWPITVGVRMRESNVGGGEGEGVVRVMRKLFLQTCSFSDRVTLVKLRLSTATKN